MKIKTKLIMGLSTKPLIIIILIISGWLQVVSLNKLSVSTQTNFDLSLLAEHIQRDIKNEAISLRNIVIFTDKDSIQKEITNIQMKSDSVTQNIALFETKVITTEQRNMVENLKNINLEFNIYKDEVIKLVSNGEEEEAINLINKNGHFIHNEFLDVITNITVPLESNMKSTFSKVTKDFQQQIWISIGISLIVIIISSGFVANVVWKLATRLSKVSNVMNSIATGKSELSTKVEVISNDEIDDVANSFNKMVQSVEEQIVREQNLIWVKSNVAEVTTSISGTHNLESLSGTFLSKITPLIGACRALFYVKDINDLNQSTYKLVGSYASDKKQNHQESFGAGEGLVGQAVLEKSTITLTDVPTNYFRVKSGLGEAQRLTIYVIPVLFDGDVKAVVELAAFKSLSKDQEAFLLEVINNLGIILESVIGRIQLAKLLEESQILMEEVQAQSEELQAQQEELRVTNEELEEQTQALRHSEQILQVQQEELEQSNSELEEKAEILENQNKMFELTNLEVERARVELEKKAKQLALSSKYKSEFLANMSHELRTPLNSLLILSKLLADNQDGNLSEKQVKYSKTIYSSGNDLLSIINDILDLAKVESGKMELNPSNVLISDLTDYVENSFRPIANEKELTFNIVLNGNLSSQIYTDEQRIQQILKNLLSNAFKFTHQGGVTLEIGWVSVSNNQDLYSFSVVDTGIGIAKEKQELIFQAFQQADGTTSRRYGGTGLGLSICREIASLLNAEIVVESEEGIGSKFTLFVTDYQEGERDNEQIAALAEVASTKEKIDVKPDIKKVGTLNRPLKAEQPQYIDLNSDIKRLLIVDDDLNQRNSLMELIGDKDLIIKAVSTGMEAIEELKLNRFDLMVLDLGLTDSNGFDLLEKIKSNEVNENLQVLIYTGRDLTTKEEIYLKKYAETIIIKDAGSPQRLEEEIELFLNPASETMEKNNQGAESSQDETFTGLEGKRVLLVDDDVRNVYALMSFLELYHMDITFAENGKESIKTLESSSAFDLVLMDIMMPEMDGYEAIRRIREIPEFVSLPIIALTAKAMKEDRQKCIEAGASDYIVKPFDTNQLISLIRVWLYQK